MPTPNEKPQVGSQKEPAPKKTKDTENRCLMCDDPIPACVVLCSFCSFRTY